MSLSDDFVRFLALLESSTGSEVLFSSDAVLDDLRAYPDFHELTERIESSIATPELLALLALRALSIQKSGLAPFLVDASLVVSFPGASAISARHTAQVVREMITAAKREILIAGFAISEAGGLPDLLVEAGRRVKSIKLVCSDWKSPAGVNARTLFSSSWPTDSTQPDVFEYSSGASKSTMHIKCLIVDGRELLLGSANFTYSGMMNNYEMGIWIKGDIANSARAIFQEFLSTGNFIKVVGIQ